MGTSSYVRTRRWHRPPGRAARRRRGLTLAAVTWLVAGFLAATPDAAYALDVCNGNWTPVVRSVTVTQGVGNTSRLTRGKATIVRAFLTAPLCAPSGSEQLLSEKVTANDAATAIGTASTPSTFGPAYPTIDSYTSGATNASTASPTLRIPALAAADANTAGFTASFTATVTYTYQAVAGGPVTTATASLGQLATAPVSAPPHPLRILVVPMGDASLAVSKEFPEAANGGVAVGSPNPQYADTAVQNGLQTLSRLMPLSDGVGDLTSTTAGLRYRLDDAAMIDLGPNGLNVMATDATTGERYFCGSSTNFSQPSGGPSISSKLAAFLSGWNNLNPTAQADRVLGVVWQGISRGTTVGCAEGFAVIGGKQAYSRVVVDTTVTSGSTPVQDPALTGSLIGMEIGHTLGGVPLADPRDTVSDYHSSNTGADPGNTGQNYDTTLVRWMSSPLSTFHYSGSTSGYTSPSTGKVSPWNDRTTLLEQPDYRYEQCQLTPGIPTADCPYGAVSGSVGAAGAGPSLSLAGTTDGTAAGTDIHSYFADPVEQTAPAPPPTVGPDYRLIQRDGFGNAIHTCSAAGCNDLGDQRVPVQAVDSDHAGGSALTTVQFGSVSGAFPVAVGSASFEVWNGEPPAGSPACLPSSMPTGCLYARPAGTAPAITTTSSGSQLTGLQDFTKAAGDETRPALSSDGSLLAWVSNGSLSVQRRDPATNLPVGPKSASLAGTDPAWSKTGTTLAYATASGDIQTVLVNAATSPPSFGASTVIYNHLLQTPPAVGSTAASHPSFSPTGAFLALALDGGIWRVNASGTTTNPVICDLATLSVTSTCVPLATDGTDSAPAWGTVGGTSGGGLVAYDKGPDLYTLDPAAPSSTRTLRLTGALLPSWSGPLVSFVAGGNIWVADSSAESAAHTWTTQTQLTTGGTDTGGTLAAGTGAIAFDRSTTSAGHDVFDATLGSGNTALTFTAQTSGDPALLRADLYVFCASAYDPIAVAVRPTSTSTGQPSTATFSVTYDAARACPGGTISTQVTNGYLSSAVTPLRTVPAATTPPSPSPAIATPSPASTFLQYDVIPATGSNADTSGGTNNGGYTLSWFLTGPQGSGYTSTAVGTGPRVDIPPPTGGWTAGSWTLTLRATSSAGQTSSTSTTYGILADPGHVGTNAIVSFTPRTLFVPSSGNDVTLSVKPQKQNLAAVDPATVRIVQVGDITTSIPIDSASGTSGWQANGDGSFNAKFSRQVLTCAMAQTGLIGGYIPVTITGTGSGGSFSGLDPVNPTTSPASPPAPC